MPDQVGKPENQQDAPASERSGLRQAIRQALDFTSHVIETGKAHSPIAPHRLEAADEFVSDCIHAGYQCVRSIAVQGHPVVILGTTGLLAALPSTPFGYRIMFRNSGLAILLGAAMIYPDHLAKYVRKVKGKEH